MSESNQFGPNYLGYDKHLVLELFSQNDGLICPSLNVDIEGSDTLSKRRPGFLFTERINAELSDIKKERLKSILNQSTIYLNREVDEILDQILAVFQIESDLKKNEIMSFCPGLPNDITEPLCDKRQNSSLVSSSSYDDIPKSGLLAQVYRDIQSQNDEMSKEAVENYSVEICSKLGKVEQDLEEFLNTVVSNCRTMTSAEKECLAQQVKMLPEKAFDRVVEIIRSRDLSMFGTHSDIIPVNLEKQDNATLWRLRYYTETVLEANRI